MHKSPCPAYSSPSTTPGVNISPFNYTRGEYTPLQLHQGWISPPFIYTRGEYLPPSTTPGVNIPPPFFNSQSCFMFIFACFRLEIICKCLGKNVCLMFSILMGNNFLSIPFCFVYLHICLFCLPFYFPCFHICFIGLPFFFRLLHPGNPSVSPWWPLCFPLVVPLFPPGNPSVSPW